MKKKNRCIAIIPARANSKRIKNKNIKKLFNKPIIYYPIQAAKNAKCFDEIYVSTDSKKIANIAYLHGAKIPYLRPKKLSNDKASTISVVNHLIKFLIKNNKKFDYVCCLYPTAIFTKPKQLLSAYKSLKKKNVNYVFTVTEYNHPIERSFVIKNNKIYKAMKKKNFLLRSNDLNKNYHDAGQFYFGKTKSFLKNIPIFQKNSNVIKLEKNNTIDINDVNDWNLAKLIFKP